MAKEIDITLKTKADVSGAKKMEGVIKGLGAAAGKLGEAFGGANTYLGQFLANLARGGLWEAGATAIGYVYRKVLELLTASERAEKAAAKTAKEVHDERMKCIGEYAAASDKLAQTRNAIISQNLKLLNEEIDATKELTKATLEFEKAEARKRGDTGRMVEIDREMDAVDFEAARAKLNNEIEAARSRQVAGHEDYRRAFMARDSARSEVRFIEAQIAQALDNIRSEAREKATGKAVVMQSSAGAYISYGDATEADKVAAAKAAVSAFKESEEYKALVDRLKDAKDKAAEFNSKMKEAKRTINEAESAEANLADRMEVVKPSPSRKIEKC